MKWWGGDQIYRQRKGLKGVGVWETSPDVLDLGDMETREPIAMENKGYSPLTRDWAGSL